MKRIKRFESFSTNHRLPEKVTYDEWFPKIGMFGEEPFTQKEVKFFEKLREENRIDIDYLDDQDVCFIYILTDSRNYFHIHKLKDDWYLIRNYVRDFHSEFVTYYICDEWDEVLGYLESKNLNLPS
jgi:hypothetical protein